MKSLARAKNQTISGYNAAPCSYFDGLYDYFNLNADAYHAAWAGQKWNGPCATLDYHVDLEGSIKEYRYLLARADKNYQIVLYNGDWDDVVPYHDTIKNIKQVLGLYDSGVYTPWFTGNQHSGFHQLYNGLLFTTFKGASHQVPQSKRAEAFQMFQSVLDGHVDKLRAQAASQ